MSKIGIYPGTFDPMTNGHLNIIQRSLKVVDKLIIGVADNLNKKPLLSIDERKNIITNDIYSLQHNNKKIEIHTVNGLLTEFAKKFDADCIIRGLRAVSDFEYEFQMTGMNYQLNPEIETIFLMSAHGPRAAPRPRPGVGAGNHLGTPQLGHHHQQRHRQPGRGQADRSQVCYI